jgi:PAS domain S-box-containing protein
MKSRRNRYPCTTALRQQAEAVVYNNRTPSRATVAAMSPEAIWGLLFELRVRQIELELQNDELRRAQQALDVSHERYFDLYELAPVAYLTVNEAGLIERANLTVTNMLGYCRKALLNQSFVRFIYEGDKDLYFLQCRQLLVSRQLQTFELRLRRHDGSLCWCGVSCGLAQEGGGLVFRVVLTDISPLKSVADPSGSFSLAVEQGPERIRIADPQAHFDFFSDALLGANAYQRNELAGNHQ